MSATITLEAPESGYLKELLTEDLKETRVEVRRTHNPEAHDELRKRETLIRGLLEKSWG
jgi:hypothetical protein